MNIFEYKYHTNADNTITLDAYLNDEVQTIYIPEEIDGILVTEINKEVFANHLEINMVILPDSLIKIGDKAFYGCQNLQIIKFGLGIKWIGSEAFAECYTLKSLQIKTVLEYLGEHAFTLCGLKSVELEGILDWQKYSYSLCSQLERVLIKRCITIPSKAFQHDICLSEVIVENLVESIDETAFYDCRSLSKVKYEEWCYSQEPSCAEAYIPEEVGQYEEQQMDQLNLPDVIQWERVILWNEPVIEDDEDMKMARLLYSKILNAEIPLESIATIFPSDAISALQMGKIPLLENANTEIALDEGEKLHYIENVILYCPNDKKDALFDCFYGIIYITDKRICLQTRDNVSENIAIDNLSKVVLYDGMPELMGILGDSQMKYIQTANTVQTYDFLKRLMNSLAGEMIKETEAEKISLTPFENGSLGTYIFELKKISGWNLPKEMHSALLEMIRSLVKLDDALEKYPSNKEQAHKFLTYYIPEVRELIISFHAYDKAGVSKSQLHAVYEKVMAAISKVSAAAVQKVDDIYQMATMETKAKAEALQKIITRDGYVESDNALNTNDLE